MREHAGGAGVGDEVVTQPGACGNGAREDAEARLGELLVTADMVGVHARVDDVADRKRRQPADRRQHLVRHRGGTGVDEDDALGPGLHDNVAARAADHVEVRPQLHDLEIARRAPVGRTRVRSTFRARGSSRPRAGRMRRPVFRVRSVVSWAVSNTRQFWLRVSAASRVSVARTAAKNSSSSSATPAQPPPSTPTRSASRLNWRHDEAGRPWAYGAPRCVAMNHRLPQASSTPPMRSP